jgi:hypothetical protein
MPNGPIENDRMRERDAMDRVRACRLYRPGQGGDRSPQARRPAHSNRLREGAEELIEWFIHYTESKGHSAYWKAIEDFRAMVEGR